MVTGSCLNMTAKCVLCHVEKLGIISFPFKSCFKNFFHFAKSLDNKKYQYSF